MKKVLLAIGLVLFLAAQVFAQQSSRSRYEMEARYSQFSPPSNLDHSEIAIIDKMEEITASLGKTFDISSNMFKPLATCALNLKGAGTGQYIDAGNVNHGFVRAADGRITTFDAPAPAAGTGAYQGTIPYANNLAGQVTGWTIDDNGVFHAFVRTP